jgi:hypothetical protein
MSTRKKKLLARLTKGIEKTRTILGALESDQRQAVLYEEPYPWTVRDLLAHFLSAEAGLLQVAESIAAGGPGAPQGLDYDAFNAEEQKRLADVPFEQLLDDLVAARQRTMQFLEALDDEKMDWMGHHPALGEVTLEMVLNAIYGHQLLHMRDLAHVLD